MISLCVYVQDQLYWKSLFFFVKQTTAILGQLHFMFIYRTTGKIGMISLHVHACIEQVTM